MNRCFGKYASLLLGASVCMTAAPVMAAPMIASMAPERSPLRSPPLTSLPAPFPQTASPDLPHSGATGERVQHHRWHRHRRDRIDAGDVIAGVVVLGTIAAIASSVSRSDERRDRDARYQERRSYPPRAGTGARGLERAAEMCVDQIERDVRVKRVDHVSRSAQGWQVTGAIFNGEGFRCVIGVDGQVASIHYGERFSYAPPVLPAAPVPDHQHADERYAAAWDNHAREEEAAAAARLQYSPPRYGRAPDNARVDTRADTRADAGEKLPAYPGGPIDGDLVEEEEAVDTAPARITPAQRF